MSSSDQSTTAVYKKKKIPARIRQQVWDKYAGKVYEAKCVVDWCNNRITVWNFDTAHNKPESKGGDMSLENLRPVCGNCNRSMGTMTIDEWNERYARPQSSCKGFMIKTVMLGVYTASVIVTFKKICDTFGLNVFLCR